jgi:hypothetical protein
MSNAEAFALALRVEVEAIPSVIRDLTVEIVTDAYEDVITRSPVLTGAYRSEHVIARGAGTEGGELLYEAPNRAGPNEPVHPPTLLDPPDAGAARSALAALEPWQAVTILNDRFYAGAIENGSSQQAPQGVYLLAADTAALRAEALVETLNRKGKA